MKELTWGRVLSVDIDEIDEDHKKLVAIFNTLGTALQQKESRVYIEAILEELINCTVWHFSHEERLMIRYQYPEYDVHKLEHAELIDSVRKLQQEILQSEESLSEDHVIFLERWLTEHILTLDMKLGAFLCQAM